MGRRIMIIVGRILFWLGWPALFVYVYFGRRTRVIISYGDTVLMGKGFLGSGRWVLPGGGVHVHESATTGAIREVREETGIELEEGQLQHLGQYRTTRGLRFTYEVFVVNYADLPATRPQRLEIADLQWLPWRTVTHVEPATENALAVWRSGRHLLH